MINQSLKRLLFPGGQAQIVLYLTPSLLGGIIFYQLDCFPLGQAMFYCINPDILQPRLKHQASIGGVTSFKFCHLWYTKFFLNSVAAASKLQLKLSSYKSLVSRCLGRLCSIEGTWDTLEVWILSLGHSTGLTMGVDVANRTCLWGVTGTLSSCSSARMSSSVSALSIGRFPRSGT